MTEKMFLKELKKQKYLSSLDDDQIELIHLEYLTTLVECVRKDKVVKLRGFGSFKLYDIKGRVRIIGDKTILIKPQHTIKFKISKQLKNDLTKSLNDISVVE